MTTEEKAAESKQAQDKEKDLSFKAIWKTVFFILAIYALYAVPSLLTRAAKSPFGAAQTAVYLACTLQLGLQAVRANLAYLRALPEDS